MRFCDEMLNAERMICRFVKSDGKYEGSVNEDSHVCGSREALQANWISIGIFGDGDGDGEGEGEGEGGREMGVTEFFDQGNSEEEREEEKKRKRKRKRKRNVREKY